MEKYGEIPKSFTAKWFEYVWEYYKWHIIVVIAVIIAALYTWYEVANRTVYDLSICFEGDVMISEQAEERLCNALKEQIADINGDGEKNIRILQTSLGQTNNIEMVQMLEEKFLLELQASDTYLYIISEARADRLLADSSADGLFEPSEAWCGKPSEKVSFCKVEDSRLLGNSGIIYNNLYAGLRNFVAGHDGEYDQAVRNNALIAAKMILGE